MKATGVKKPLRKKAKTARKKPPSITPIILTPAQEIYLETIIQEGMARMRWTRAYAERKARKFLSKANSSAKLRMVAARLGSLDLNPPKPEPKPLEKVVPGKKKLPKNTPKARRPLTRAEIAKLPLADPRPAPRTDKERMERALGPDDGKRRRGGSPVVQGGSPGLGRRS